MEKVLNKENIAIAAIVIYSLIQANYFATKLDLANLRIEFLNLQNTQKSQILAETDKKFDEINKKLDKILKVY